MNLIWAHDHYFIYDLNSGDYFSEIEFGYSTWERYLYSFQEIIIISRVIERNLSEKEKSKYNLSSGPNVSFIHLPNINKISEKVKNNYRVNEKIKKTVKKSDAVIARLPSQIGMLVLDCAKKYNKPTAIELVGCPEEALNNLRSLKAKLYKTYMVRKTKKLVKESKYTLYVTKDFLQNKYPSAGKTIACSNVILKTFDQKNNELKLQETKNEVLKVGLIGYLSEYKGIDTAFRICSELQQKNIPYNLEILGAGDKKKWGAIANSLGVESKAIKIFSLPSGEAVFNWLKTLDFYIQPSRTEGLPRGLIEAMAAGNAAIGSNVGGIPELLSDKEIFDKEDYKLMANRIEEIVRNESMKKEIENRNMKVAQEYSFTLLDKKRKNFWREFYNDVLLSFSEEGK